MVWPKEKSGYWKGKKNPKHSLWMKENNPMKGKKSPKLSERNRANPPRKGKKSPERSKQMKGIPILCTFKGKRHSPETIIKMKEAHKGKEQKSLITRSKISATLKGRYCGEENSMWGKKKPAWSEHMKNGFAAYACSCNKSPSKPQVQLFEKIKLLYPLAILQYQYKNRCIDIAIVEQKIAIEYDGPYWHQDEGYHRQRQEELENDGWKFIRYNKLPSEREMNKDLERIIQNGKDY